MGLKKKNKKVEDYYFTNKVKGISNRDRTDLHNLKYYPIWSFWTKIKFHILLHKDRKFKKEKDYTKIKTYTYTILLYYMLISTWFIAIKYPDGEPLDGLNKIFLWGYTISLLFSPYLIYYIPKTLNKYFKRKKKKGVKK